MITYSTCAGCAQLLQVTDNQNHHPTCTPKLTKAEQLAQQWLTAAENGDNELADQLQQQIDQLDSRPPRLLQAALLYASWGWPVFPLRTNTKTPATKHGFKDATTDTQRIKAWWTRHPDHNIGLPTGINFDVIDIDVPDGPRSMQKIIESQNSIKERGGAIPDFHGIVATSSGGSHYYIKPTGGGNKAGMLPGIDVRGAGGYVVAPPSTLGQRGRAWSWAIKPSPLIKQNANQEGGN